MDMHRLMYTGSDASLTLPDLYVLRQRDGKLIVIAYLCARPSHLALALVSLARPQHYMHRSAQMNARPLITV